MELLDHMKAEHQKVFVKLEDFWVVHMNILPQDFYSFPSDFSFYWFEALLVFLFPQQSWVIDLLPS